MPMVVLRLISGAASVEINALILNLGTLGWLEDYLEDKLCVNILHKCYPGSFSWCETNLYLYMLHSGSVIIKMMTE